MSQSTRALVVTYAYSVLAITHVVLSHDHTLSHVVFAQDTQIMKKMTWLRGTEMLEGLHFVHFFSKAR